MNRFFKEKRKLLDEQHNKYRKLLELGQICIVKNSIITYDIKTSVGSFD